MTDETALIRYDVALMTNKILHYMKRPYCWKLTSTKFCNFFRGIVKDSARCYLACAKSAGVSLFTAFVCRATVRLKTRKAVLTLLYSSVCIRGGHRSGVDSGRILRFFGSWSKSKLLNKPDPDPELLFISSSMV